MGHNHFESVPTAAYGVVLMMAAIAYKLLQTAIVNHEKGDNKLLASAVQHDLKGNLSIVLYAIAIPLAFVNEWIADAIYAGVALTWFVPDRRIEQKVEEKIEEEQAEKDETRDIE